MYLKVVDKVSKLDYYVPFSNSVSILKRSISICIILRYLDLCNIFFSTLALFVPPSIGLIMDQNHQRSTNNTYPHF